MQNKTDMQNEMKWNETKLVSYLFPQIFYPAAQQTEGSKLEKATLKYDRKLASQNGWPGSGRMDGWMWQYKNKDKEESNTKKVTLK